MSSSIDGRIPEIIYALIEEDSLRECGLTFLELRDAMSARPPSPQRRTVAPDYNESEDSDDSEFSFHEGDHAYMSVTGANFDDSHVNNEVSDEWYAEWYADNIPGHEADYETEVEVDEIEGDGAVEENRRLLQNDRSRYNAVIKRLRNRASDTLQKDTDFLLARDFFHNVHQLYNPNYILTTMFNTDTAPSLFHHSVPEDVQRRVLDEDGCLLSCPYRFMYQDPIRTNEYTQRIVLRHVYLAGWGGVPSVDATRAREWYRAGELAEGRFKRRAIYFTLGDMVPTLVRSITNLGFPTVETFMCFVFHTDIRNAFRELWDDELKNLEQDTHLATNHAGRRPVALRIFYSRAMDDDCEYTADEPDKTFWEPSCYLARFCLQVERVCNRELLPPMRGQLPVMPGKVSCATVAWGGIELARVLRRMQKGQYGRRRYLDDAPSGELARIRVAA